MKGSGAIVLGIITLTIAAALTIGSRLSDQALAALAGAVCGIGLSVPLGLSLGIIIGAARNRKSLSESAPPRIVVVQTPPPSPSTAPAYPTLPGPMAPAPRLFTIIGDDDAEG